MTIKTTPGKGAGGVGTVELTGSFVTEADGDDALRVVTPPINTELHSETLTWDGTATALNTGDIPVLTSRAVVIFIDNHDVGQDVNLKFEHKVGELYADHHGGDGELFTIDGIDGGDVPTARRVIGPIQGWPLFAGGRINVATYHVSARQWQNHYHNGAGRMNLMPDVLALWEPV